MQTNTTFPFPPSASRRTQTRIDGSEMEWKDSSESERWHPSISRYSLLIAFAVAVTVAFS